MAPDPQITNDPPSTRRSPVASSEPRDWAKLKAERQKQGNALAFKEGDVVRVKGFLKKDAAGGITLHVDADGRVADNFKLNKASIPAEFEKSIGAPFTLDIKITKPIVESGTLSNIQNYEVDLKSVVKSPKVNPPEAEVSELDLGERVLIRGKFLGFVGEENDQDGYPSNKNTAKIELADKRVVEIAMPTGRFVFSGGRLRIYIKNIQCPETIFQSLLL